VPGLGVGGFGGVGCIEMLLLLVGGGERAVGCLWHVFVGQWLLLLVLLGVMVWRLAEEAKGPVGEVEAAEEDDGCEDLGGEVYVRKGIVACCATVTYHALVTEFLDEAVKNHSKRLGRHTGACHLLRIALHTRFPDTAQILERWGHVRGAAVVAPVVEGAGRKLDHDLGGVLVGFDLHVGLDAGPGAVDEVEEAEA